MVGIATGLADAGYVPYVYSIATFATLRPYEFIRNGPVHQRLPVRVVGVGGGFDYGTNGPSHHALEDLAVMRVQPGMTVVAPADFEQARASLHATHALPGPVYFRLGKDESSRVAGLDGRFRLGRAETIGSGGDLLLVTTGGIARNAVAAAEALAASGIDATVLVAASLSPPPADGPRRGPRAVRRRGDGRGALRQRRSRLARLRSRRGARPPVPRRPLRRPRARARPLGQRGVPQRDPRPLGRQARRDVHCARLGAGAPVTKLSAVIACYRDAPAIPQMHERLTTTLRQLGVDYEIVFVNDASPDDARAGPGVAGRADPHVVVVNHTRNFGSQSAFTSGMAVATGDAVVLLDGDLQDPPELIDEFYARWRDGYDVVYGVRERRMTTLPMQLAYKLFYRVLPLALVRLDPPRRGRLLAARPARRRRAERAPRIEPLPAGAARVGRVPADRRSLRTACTAVRRDDELAPP
jgi:hypothetical protein